MDFSRLGPSSDTSAISKTCKTQVSTGPFENLTRTGVVLLFLALAATFRLRLASIAEPGDDAFMTLRMVQNILHGEGFVYNHGSKVLSSTTPLYVLVVSGLCALLKTDPVILGKWFNLFFDVLNLALLFFIVLKSSKREVIAGLAAATFGLSRYSALASLLYMETPLFVSLLLLPVFLTVCWPQKNFRHIAALLAGISLICRPEGILIMASFVIVWTWQDRKLPVREILLMGVGYAPWFAFSIWYFGDIIPYSVKGKRLGYIPYEHQAFIEMWYHFSILFSPGEISAKKIPILSLTIMGLTLFIFGSREIAIRAPRALVLIVFNTLFFTLYALANQFMFLWYLVPLEPGFILAVLFGALRIFEIIATILPLRLVRVLATLIASIYCAGILERYNFSKAILQPNNSMLSFTTGEDFQPNYGLHFKREAWYRKAALALESHVDSATTVLTPEFGVLGYFLPVHIISSVGHVSPEVLPFLPPPFNETAYPEINNSIPKSMVRGLKPDYVVTPEIFIRKSILVDEWFSENYRLLKKFPVSIYGSDGLYIFQRNDLPEFLIAD